MLKLNAYFNSDKVSGLLSGTLLISSVAAIVFLLAITVKVWEIVASDYVSYIKPANIYLEGQRFKLYDLDLQIQTQNNYLSRFGLTNLFITPFIYPPFVGLFFIPFAYLEITTGYKLFVVIMLLMFFAFSWLIQKKLNLGKFTKWVSVLIFFFPPTFNSLHSPQFNAVLAILLLGTFLLIKNNKPFKAGILTALLVIKPQYLTLAPFVFLLVKNKNNYLKGFVYAFILLTLLSFSIVGFDGLQEYFSLLRITDVPEYGNRIWLMQSFASVFVNLGLVSQHQTVTILGLNFVLYAITLLIFIARIKYIDIKAAYASAVIFCVSFGYHVLNHDLVLLLPAIFLIVSLLLKRKRKKKNYRILFLILLALYVTSFNYFSENNVVTALTIFASGYALLLTSKVENKGV